VESFLDDREFCRKHGTPWRRGYLLEGPHGTGKTSLVRALAHEYEMDLYEVNVCSASMDDGKLKHAMSQIGEGDIALIEDVDGVYDDSTDSSVTPRGFSVAIDGVAEQPGRVLFMTTNNSDMLEERITRSGRVDRTFRLGLATTDMARRLFLKFFPGQDNKARQFAETLGNRTRSPAAIQGHFMQYRDADQALAQAREIETSTGDNNYA
jgi:chaperone BCS1